MSNASTRVAIVTGTSSGIGEALARELLRREWRVVGVSRRVAALESPGYSHVQLDLADTAALTGRLDEALGPVVADSAVTRLALVNNAADPGLLGPLDRVDPVAMLRISAINVVGPAALMGWLVRRSRSDVPLRVVNVSSGAATVPFTGFSAYGSSKAALRMVGMILATELESAEHPASARADATVMSYDPGVVDTAMQATVRESTIEVLPSLETFKHLLANGLLAPPEAPAGEIADYLDGDGHARFSEQSLGAPPSA